MIDPIVDVAMIALAVEALNSFTSDRYSKKRYAVPISVMVGFIMVSIDQLLHTELSGILHGIQILWGSLKQGFEMGMAAGGAHAAFRNYMDVSNNNKEVS